MSEVQQSHKKNKKKKKNSVNGNSTVQVDSEAIKSKEAPKLDNVIKEILPQKVGVTTKIKDVEVTMTNSGNEAVNGTLKKKKKKKKKGKQQSGDDAEKSSANEADNQNLLNFTENHIELVNHPEISVTISTAPVAQPEEPVKPPEDKKSEDQKVPPEEVAAPNSLKKKKKNKKKKKKKTEENETPAPSAPTEPAEDTHSTPTYVKLPADGGNCVLLVSHESFSNGNKQVASNSTSDAQNKTATVVLKKTETKEPAPANNDTPSNNSNIQNSSVSIFPVFSDPNKKPEKKPEFNVSSSMGKISDMIKNESESSPTKDGAVSEAADPTVAEENVPTKAQLKAERRAKQEAQRAAKLAKSTEMNSSQTNENTKLVNSHDQPTTKQNVVSKDTSSSKDAPKVSAEREIGKKVHIFSHLPQHQDLLARQITDIKVKIPHPIIELGSHYSMGTLCGSNARCVGFLGALRQVIIEYKTPMNKIFSKDLESKLQTYLEFLGNCRPLSVSVINAMKFLKHQINHISEDMAEERAKESLCQSINNYVREEILLAKEAITISASAKIVNNDTILVFAYSSLVKEVLCKAHDQNKSFLVIVVDSRPKLEGLEMLRQLVKHGLQCSYISINAVSSVMRKVSKVIIGAHALLANGYVMSRLGCKILSLVGSTNSVPVLVCCETYKFWERSLTDSIVHNELGNPNDLVTMSLDKKDSLLKWHDMSSLHIYNLLYDVTPSELISVVITEKGLVPCTSVPVLLRVKHAGLQE